MRAETLCAPVLAATVNGVYQGIILTILVGMLLRLVPRTNASTRHAVWFVSLVVVAMIVPAHYWLGHTALPPNNKSGIAPRSPAITPPPPETLPQEMDLSFGLDLPGDAQELGPEIPFEPLPLASSAPQPAIDGKVSSTITPVRIADQYSPGQDQGALPAGGWAKQYLLQPIPWSFGAQKGWPIAAVLVGFCLSVAALRLVLLGVRLTRLAQLTEHAICPAAELQSLFEHLRANAQVNRDVSLKVSELHRTPLVLGFFHPVILIPADLAADSELAEAKHVLAHELAHVRRYDDWANLFQHFVQAVLFFHPSVWWINRKLSLEREIACDDHVLLHSTGPRTYALVLASVAKRISQRAPRLAPGVWNSNSQLQQRISMILNTRRNSSPALAKTRLAWIVTATVLVGVAALQIGPRVVFAESPAPKPAAVITANTPSPNAPHAVVLSSDAVSPVPAVISLVAQADAPGVEPGPKFKPEAPGEVAPAAEPPEGPDAPSLDAVPPSPPHVARMSKPGKLRVRLEPLMPTTMETVPSRNECGVWRKWFASLRSSRKSNTRVSTAISKTVPIRNTEWLSRTT